MPPKDKTTFQYLVQAGNRAWQSVTRGRKKPRRRNIRYIKGVHKGQFYRRKLDYKPPPPSLPKLPIAGQAVMPKPLTHLPPPPPPSSTSATASTAVPSSGEAARQVLTTTASAPTWEQQLRRILEWLRQNFPVLVLNFGSLCTLTGFTRQDVLELRALSMTGSLTFVVYQSYQTPLRWAPIYWSLLFASVNGYNISKILLERKGKVTLTEHEEELFVEHFMPHGVTPKQFEIILSKAKIVRYRKGEPIVSKGEPLDKVYLVTTGSTRASIGGRRLTAISTRPGNVTEKHGGDSGAWIGEMAFLEAFGKDEMDLKKKEMQLGRKNERGIPDEKEEQPSAKPHPHRRLDRAIYHIVAQEDGVEVLTWSHDDIVYLMHLSTDMRASMTRAMTAPIVGKVINFSISKTKAVPPWTIWLDDWKYSGAANVKTTLIQDQGDENNSSGEQTGSEGKKEAVEKEDTALEPVM